VASCYLRVHRSIGDVLKSVAATLACIGLVSSVSAADAPQSPRPHSLIQRQTPGISSAETSLPATVPGTASTPSARSPHRKLTKRPTQTSAAGDSVNTATPYATAPSAQPVAPAQTSRTGTEGRVSMAATGMAALSASMVTSTPSTSMATASAPPATLTPSTGKTPVAGALTGTAAAAPTRQSAATSSGRGLQRLASQLPGLTQLVAPTVSISSPPPAPAPSSAPSPGTTQPPPSTAPPAALPPPPPTPPPGTGNATLSWTLNSESDLAGYKIYVGAAPGLYTYPGSPFAVGLVGGYTITGLPVGQTYYFAISAFDYFGDESALSAEVSKSIY